MTVNKYFVMNIQSSTRFFCRFKAERRILRLIEKNSIKGADSPWRRDGDENELRSEKMRGTLRNQIEGAFFISIIPNV